MRALLCCCFGHRPLREHEDRAFTPITMTCISKKWSAFGVAIKICGRCGVLYVSHVMRDSIVLPVDYHQGLMPFFSRDNTEGRE